MRPCEGDGGHATASSFPDLKGQAPLRPLQVAAPNVGQFAAFPDLKGQAPLRLEAKRLAVGDFLLFLTSKVRLHCDQVWVLNLIDFTALFLTSKVRLHCDGGAAEMSVQVMKLFLTSKVRLHCDLRTLPPHPQHRSQLFLTSKVRLHCDRVAVRGPPRR